MARRKRPTSGPSFHRGQKVRVRHGVTDTDYPDIPLSGWAGTIVRVDNDDMLMVRWSEQTLASIHPVFKKRCERDGLTLEEYWLGAHDIELDAGGPLEIGSSAE